MTAVWCIRRRGGWCATRDGAEPSEEAWNDPTACGEVVTLRIGSERREPDCGECREALRLVPVVRSGAQA